MSRFGQGYKHLADNNTEIPLASIGKLPLNLTNEVHHLPPKSFASAQRPVWKRALWQTSVGLIWAGILVALGTVFVVAAASGNFQDCGAGDYSLFAVDSTFGSYSMGQAKLIDVTFNVVAGRGVQGILVYVSYCTTTNMLMRLMETTPVHFNLFSTLAFNPSGISTIWPVLKAFVTLPGWRPKFIMMWILFSSAFLLTLPTLMDTMSGYVQKQDSYYTFADKSKFPVLSSTNVTQLVLEHGAEKGKLCIPSDDGTYQWGFASTWVFITWILLGVWMLGTYSSWMDSQHHSELTRKGRTMNSFRAAADLAEAMTEALGPNTAAYSGSELQKALANKPRIMYDAEVDDITGLGRIRATTRKSGKMGKLRWTLLYGEEKSMN